MAKEVLWPRHGKAVRESPRKALSGYWKTFPRHGWTLSRYVETLTHHCKTFTGHGRTITRHLKTVTRHGKIVTRHWHSLAGHRETFFVGVSSIHPSMSALRAVL